MRANAIGAFLFIAICLCYGYSQVAPDSPGPSGLVNQSTSPEESTPASASTTGTGRQAPAPQPNGKDGRLPTWSPFTSILLPCLTVVGMLCLIFGVGVRWFTGYARRRIDEWLGHDERYGYGKSEFKLNVLSFSEKSDGWPESVKNRLKDQHKEIQIRWKIHLNVAMFYYMRYYMAITMATITAIVAAMPLFYISIHGWLVVQPAIRAAFLVALGSMVFFAAFPMIYKSRRNIEENKSLFISYAQLENWVETFAVTGLDAQGKPAQVEEFIHNLDVQLAALHKFPIEFDPSAIPSPRKIVDGMSVPKK